MKKTKNNKGFSLVELIVVVLILGILAVAVTPQVMKWVDKSKIASDQDSANALKAAVQNSVAEWQAYGGKLPTVDTSTYTISVNKNGGGTSAATGVANPTSDWAANSQSKTIKDYLDAVVANEYPKAQYGEISGTTNGFVITVQGKTGKIEVNYEAKNVVSP